MTFKSEPCPYEPHKSSQEINLWAATETNKSGEYNNIEKHDEN